MTYTVNQLAQLSGVTTRTLHHYDQIGLLQPIRDEANGYRLYGAPELLRLQHILFYRELGFSLGKIGEILDSSDYTAVAILEDQKKLLKKELRRKEMLVGTLSKTIKKLKTRKPMHDKELYEGLSEHEIEAYTKEAEERWGETDAYKQSMERTKKWDGEEWAVIKKEGQDITVAIADMMDAGHTSTEVQRLIQRHWNHLNRFYDINCEIYSGLAQMYVTDPRFKKFYENIKPGLADFMSKAMLEYCRTSRA